MAVRLPKLCRNPISAHTYPYQGETGANPTDRGKRGVKRSLLTEAQGVPVGLAVDGANRHDIKLVRATVDSLPMPRPAPSPEHPQGLCLDKGYDFAEVRRTLAEFGFTAYIRSRWWRARSAGRLQQEAREGQPGGGRPGVG